MEINEHLSNKLSIYMIIYENSSAQLLFIPKYVFWMEFNVVFLLIYESFCNLIDVHTPPLKLQVVGLRY